MGRGTGGKKGGLYRIYYRRNVTFSIDGRKIRFSRKEAYALAHLDREEFSCSYFVGVMASGGYSAGTARYVLHVLVKVGVLERVSRGLYRVREDARVREVRAGWCGEALLRLLEEEEREGRTGEGVGSAAEYFTFRLSALRTAFLELLRASRLKGDLLDEIRALTSRAFCELWGHVSAPTWGFRVVRILYRGPMETRFVDLLGLKRLIEKGLLGRGVWVVELLPEEWTEEAVAYMP